MRKTIFVVLFTSVLFAQQGYLVVESYQIGPGCHYAWYSNASLPMQVYVTTMDLSNPYIHLENVTAHDLMSGNEKTSSMSKRTSHEGHEAVCAVNGDFYDVSNGLPLSPTVINGEFTHTPFIYRNGFAYTLDKKGSIFNPIYSGEVLTMDESLSYTINNINLARQTNDICLYNNFFGTTTQTSGDGTECLIRSLEDWVVNDTMLCVVESCDISSNRTIPDGKQVLSGSGEGATFLSSHCNVGDTIKIVQSFPKTKKKITQFMGGACQILSDGVNVAEESGTAEFVWSEYLWGRNPRTAIGFNGDSTIAYFVVVDGRQPSISIGMGMDEMADFMKAIGAKNAVNLDGGGSSTMVVRHSFKNSVSDGWERSVSNAVMCVSSAPDADLSIVQIERDSIAVYKNNTFDVPMSGWDAYYNPKDIPSGSGLQVDFTPGLGVYNDGTFTCSDADMDGMIYTDLNGVKDSMSVHIISIDSLTCYPKQVMTDTMRTIDFFVYGKEDGGQKEQLENSIFEFELLDPSIGSIDENGVFTPTKAGETQLIVHYGTSSDTANITVEQGVSETLIDEIESLDDWTFSGENLDMNLSTVQLIDRAAGSGSKAIRVDYTTTDNGTILLETPPITVYGIPNEFLIDAMSDGLNHRLYLVFDDANGNEYRFKASGFFNDSDYFVTKTLSSTAIIPGDGAEYYPMHLKQIFIDLANGVQSGSLYVDFIRCTYPGWTAIEELDHDAIPSDFMLEQNYPNPFNPTTAINYSLAQNAEVELSIYDINGRKIATLIEGMQAAGAYSLKFNASTMPGGVYIYRLQAGQWSDTKKMLLIK